MIGCGGANRRGSGGDLEKNGDDEDFQIGVGPKVG